MNAVTKISIVVLAIALVLYVTARGAYDWHRGEGD